MNHQLVPELLSHAKLGILLLVCVALAAGMVLSILDMLPSRWARLGVGVVVLTIIATLAWLTLRSR